MTLSRFEIDFQGGQMRVWANSTLKGSLTYVTARRAGRTAMVFWILESKSRQDSRSRRSGARSFSADLEEATESKRFEVRCKGVDCKRSQA